MATNASGKRDFVPIGGQPDETPTLYPMWPADLGISQPILRRVPGSEQRPAPWKVQCPTARGLDDPAGLRVVASASSSQMGADRGCRRRRLCPVWASDRPWDAVGPRT